MVEVFLEERLKEASVLPLWLHLRRATAYEPRPTEKPCMWFWRELKSLGNAIGDVLGSIGPKKTASQPNPDAQLSG